MCHLNLIMNKKQINSESISEAMNVVTWSSWNRNNDGEGFIGKCRNRLYKGKSEDKIVYKGKYSFLLTHQRYATIGDGKQNIHPHDSKDFLLMHNGIFSNIGTDKKSDTKIYLNQLQKDFSKTKILTSSIKNLSKKNYGSYSIFVYNKNDKQFYYFKDSSTNMYIIEDKDWLVMSTSKENCEYCKCYFSINEDIKKVSPNVIYKLNERLIEVDLFKSASQYYSWDSDDISLKSASDYADNLIDDMNTLKYLYENDHLSVSDKRLYEEAFIKE